MATWDIDFRIALPEYKMYLSSAPPGQRSKAIVTLMFC